MILSIDPGDKHVGMAEFELGVCVCTYTMGRHEAEDRIRDLVLADVVEKIICEEWTLYSWNATDLIGSEMLTSQLIGVIRYLSRTHSVPLFMQPTAIKKPTFKQMANRHIQPLGDTQHELDAEAHGYHHIARLS